MITAKKAKKLSTLDIGEQEDRTYGCILEACLAGKKYIEIGNEFISLSDVNRLRNFDYEISFPGNGKTKIEWT
jgi:hypothetical protein